MVVNMLETERIKLRMYKAGILELLTDPKDSCLTRVKFISKLLTRSEWGFHFHLSFSRTVGAVYNSLD